MNFSGNLKTYIYKQVLDAIEALKVREVAVKLNVLTAVIKLFRMVGPFLL
jgi:hypothetical protein